jgi:hypothetical protein
MLRMVWEDDEEEEEEAVGVVDNSGWEASLAWNEGRASMAEKSICRFR